MPDCFRTRFIALGWQGIKEHYGVHSRVISRWLDEEGRDDLVAARAAHVVRLRERDRAFRRRVAMMGTTAGLPADAVARIHHEQQTERLRA